MHGVLNA
jgi:hypothetical protein